MRKRIAGLMGCVALVTTSAGCSMDAIGSKMYANNMKAQQDKLNPIPETVKRPAHFPEAVPLLRDAFGVASQRLNPPPAFIRGYAKNDDWEMDRNARGVITGREVDAVIFYKGGQSGFCRMEHVKLFEENQGGQHWGKPTVSTMGTYGPQPILTMGFHVDCAAIDALPPDPA
jgi:hypothetical protein